MILKTHTQNKAKSKQSKKEGKRKRQKKLPPKQFPSLINAKNMLDHYYFS